MALSLPEIKELVAFGHGLGLQSLQAEGVVVIYGPSLPALTPEKEKQPEDENTSGLPEELRHYSAQGKAAWGKAG